MSSVDMVARPQPLEAQAPVQRPAQARPGGFSRLRAFLSTGRIDLLRSWAWIVVPLMVVIGAAFVHQELIPGVVLWSNLSQTVGATTLFLPPLAMGYTAWRLQASSRARMLELESIAPTSPARRDLRRILSSTLVVVLGQLALVALALGYGARFATWGEPLWWPLVLSVATVFAAGVFGGTVGALVSWRMAPPLLALVALVGSLVTSEGLLGFQRTQSLLVFLPFEMVMREYVDPFWTRDSAGASRSLARLFLLAGLALLSLLVFARRRSVVAWAMAALLCGSTMFAGVMHRDHWQDPNRMGFGWEPPSPRPFTYACEPWRAGSICLHPAYTSLTDELRAQADRVLAPLAGLPGMPTTLRHAAGDASDDGRTIWIWSEGLYDDWRSQFGHNVIRQAVGVSMIHEGYPNLHGGWPSNPDSPQMVIGRWLSVEAELDSSWFFQGIPPTDADDGTYWDASSSAPEPDWSVEISAAIERFAVLSPPEQRAWLEANWDALRSGELTLEELP